MSSTIAIARRPLLLLLAASLAGCAGSMPTGRYEAFRAANESVQSSTSETYTRIERRQRDFAVMTAPDAQLSADSFKPTVRGKSYDISAQLQAREAALDVLVKYAQSLEALAGKDFSTQLDKSTQDLGASLRRLGSSDTAATAANAFTVVADELGRAATGHMRKEALRKAMDAGQPGVEAISRLLLQDNERIALFVGLMRDRYIAHAQLSRPPYATWNRYRFDLEVASALEEFEDIDGSLKSASAAIQKIPEAHRQILESLDKHERPLDALRDLIGEARRLRSFYRSLPTN